MNEGREYYEDWDHETERPMTTTDTPPPSETPRTDSQKNELRIAVFRGEMDWATAFDCMSGFARQLERENARLKGRNDLLEKRIRVFLEHLGCGHEAERFLSEAQPPTDPTAMT